MTMKIGELAKATGITVRTLHHYDKIGLLTPNGERESGHRLYTAADVKVLGQILAFKSMGLSLEKISLILKQKTFDLQKTLKLQEEVLSANIHSLQKARRNLRYLLDRFAHHKSVSTQELLSFIKEVQTMEKYYTPQQLQYLETRYEKFSDKAKEVEKAWPVLFKKAEEAFKAGLPENNLKVQVLAAEAQLYIDLFTGGDKEIEASLEKYNKENLDAAIKSWGISKEAFEYLDRVRKSLKSLKKN